jgi:glycosyltransferase involved in cell wall biosynthesis
VRKRFDGRLRVLFVGRLSRAKNVDILLRALAQANAAGAELTCTVAGTGSELDSLRHLAARLGIQECVEFTGGMGYEKVLDQFERAHILVLVSESEGWPKALVEAMTYGLLCIGSKSVNVCAHEPRGGSLGAGIQPRTPPRRTPDSHRRCLGLPPG